MATSTSKRVVGAFNMTTQEAEQVAIHEAAHVVAAHRFGHRITRADLSGCEVAVPTADGVTPAGQAAHETVIVSMAGGIAAQRFNGNGANGDGSDNAYVNYLALRLSNGRENESAALLDWLRCRAVTIVEQNWRQIQAIAAALTERSTLNGDEINEIINGETQGDIAK
jgi:ATP-dependent Zn protease